MSPLRLEGIDFVRRFIRSFLCLQRGPELRPPERPATSLARAGVRLATER
jgi:hypothetical protein